MAQWLSVPITLAPPSVQRNSREARPVPVGAPTRMMSRLMPLRITKQGAPPFYAWSSRPKGTVAVLFGCRPRGPYDPQLLSFVVFRQNGGGDLPGPTLRHVTNKHSTSETSLWVRHLNPKDQRVFGPHVRHAKRSHLASSAGCAWLQLYSHLLARGQDSSSKMHCSTLVVSLILTTGSGDGRSLLFGSTW